MAWVCVFSYWCSRLEVVNLLLNCSKPYIKRWWFRRELLPTKKWTYIYIYFFIYDWYITCIIYIYYLFTRICTFTHFSCCVLGLQTFFFQGELSREVSAWLVGDLTGVTTQTRWGVQTFFMFTPKTGGNDPIWRVDFSDGLVQPPTSKELSVRIQTPPDFS